MSNVLDHHKQHEVLALGRLGWTLRRIADATGVHRVTVGGYLRAAGIAVRGRGRPGEGPPKPTISSEEVSTDPAAKPATTSTVPRDSGPPKPAISGGVSTDLPRPSPPGRAPSASACEPYREL